MVINDLLFLGVCRTHGVTEVPKRLSHDSLYTTTTTIIHLKVCVWTGGWMAVPHILLIHLVHLGIDSPTFASERRGKCYQTPFELLSA